jgi:outer membrane protein TolC
MMAGLRIDEAESRVREARSALLPNLSASAATLNRTMNMEAFGISIPAAPGEEQNPLVGPFANFDARLHFSVPVFDFAAIQRTRSAREAVAGASAGERVAGEGAAERAALAYLRASRAEARLEAREADAALAQELLVLAEEQFRAGVSPAIDVTRARTQQVAAEGQVLQARNGVDLSYLELSRAMGTDPGTRFQLTRDLEGFASGAENAAAEVLVSRALSQRPELQQTEAERKVNEATSRAIRAERLPRVALVADYGASGLHPSDAIATREIGVQLSVPVFDGFRREARLEAQNSSQRITEVRDADLREQISAEVRSALLQQNSGVLQERVAREQLALAEDELSQARERFTNGVASNIEVINAQASLLHARDVLIEAQFVIANARAGLAYATGTAAELR